MDTAEECKTKEKDQEDRAALGEGEEGGETQPERKAGDVESVDRGAWLVVEGSDVPICVRFEYDHGPTRAPAFVTYLSVCTSRA